MAHCTCSPFLLEHKHKHFVQAHEKHTSIRTTTLQPSTLNTLYPRNLTQAEMGIKISVLDPTPGCPASTVAEQTVGSFQDFETVKAFAKGVDILTVEIEHIDTSAMQDVLDNTEVDVEPQPQTLRTIQVGIVGVQIGEVAIMLHAIVVHCCPPLWYHTKQQDKHTVLSCQTTGQVSAKGAFYQKWCPSGPL